MNFRRIILLVLFFLLTVFPLKAAEIENYYLQTSFYTHHYSQKDYHNNRQKLIGVERHYSNDKLDGIAFFKNTYQQQTVFIYKGKNYSFHKFKKIELTGKLTYGIIHGYDDENGRYSAWMNKVGTFPGVIFGFGLRKKPYRLDILPFANAGIIITGGIEF